MTWLWGLPFCALMIYGVFVIADILTRGEPRTLPRPLAVTLPVWRQRIPVKQVAGEPPWDLIGPDWTVEELRALHGDGPLPLHAGGERLAAPPEPGPEPPWRNPRQWANDLYADLMTWWETQQ